MLLGVEAASGKERFSWRLVFPTGPLGVKGTAESSRLSILPGKEKENKEYKLCSVFTHVTCGHICLLKQKKVFAFNKCLLLQYG